MEVENNGREPVAGEAFFNREVPPESLPRYEAVALNRAERSFAWYQIITAIWFWPLVGLASLATSYIPRIGFQSPVWVTAILFALVIPGLIHGWLYARRIGWAVREHDLIYRTGVIWRRTIILPFTRIQHVETLSGPIERWLRLMRVKCFTAGGMTADLTLYGLSADQARQVRQFLLEQIRDKPAGSRDHDED